MSCDASERKTYDNIRRLARLAAQLTKTPQTIYKERGKETYAFCRKCDYTPERGDAVNDVAVG